MKKFYKKILLIAFAFILLLFSITFKVDALKKTDIDLKKIDEDLKKLNNSMENLYVDLIDTIEKIEIDGYVKPKAGQTVSENLKDIKIFAEEIFIVKNIYWKDIVTNQALKDTDIFEDGSRL